ncbi:MAG: VOC family protein [Chroococcidiopsidaceae cyanobacterium CP_BM_RX_35]|nr:VOC family protein [Chroococcidiopsidaceae cyanobacterium CP_BM_RX_35]
MGVSIQGLFETHLTVRNLATSLAFYRDRVGLELAYLLPERRVAFF